jgi:transcriptional regulator with XRE-family HTH domain
MNTIREKIIEHIQSRGWSVPTTAKRSGLPIPTIKNIVYGKSLTHKKRTLEKLANAFGCRVEDLSCPSQIPIVAKTERNNPDFEVLDECFHALRSYIKNRNLPYNTKQWLKVIDNLSSFVIKKRASDSSYKLMDDIVECTLDNLTS